MFTARLALALIFATTLVAHSQSTYIEPVELRREQSLRNAKLTKQKRQALARAIVKQIRDEIGEPKIDGLEESALDTSVMLVDLDGDKNPEIVAQAMREEICSPTGNCSFWVFREDHGEYKLILKGMAQLFRIYRSRTNHFRDIGLGTHGSAYYGGWHFYRFSGSRYTATKCWGEIYGDSDHDKPYSKPKIEPCG